MTLVEQFVRDQARVPAATGELSTILSRLSLAGRMIANEIMRAGFVGKLGHTGEQNVQGEQVRELDVIANDIFIQVFEMTNTVSCLASEEMEHIYHYPDEQPGKYLVLFDPLDGSSNVDVNGPMGSIFSIHRRTASTPRVDDREFLRTGVEQVAAGYILYGPSTMFVYALDDGPVNAFTLDRSIGAFFLTHSGMRIPDGKGTYSVNESNESRWDERTRDAVRRFRHGEVKRTARYIGALVADFHRTLVKGGIFMYPGEVAKPEGKLRLLYEAAPLALVARQAGGHATDGRQPILDIRPDKLHQRCPLFIGSKGDVEDVMRHLEAGSARAS